MIPGRSEDLIHALSYSATYNLLGMPAGAVAATRIRPGEESDRPNSRDLVERAARQTETGSAGLPVGVQGGLQRCHQAESQHRTCSERSPPGLVPSAWAHHHQDEHGSKNDEGNYEASNACHALSIFAFRVSGIKINKITNAAKATPARKRRPARKPKW